jgi:predicted transcriptional regulator
MAKQLVPEPRGHLEQTVADVVWELGEATVADVRAHQPEDQRPGYDTVATVFRRLHTRGLLERERRGKAYVYRPRLSEAELLASDVLEQFAMLEGSDRTEALRLVLERLPSGELADLLSAIKGRQRSRRAARGNRSRRGRSRDPGKMP